MRATALFFAYLLGCLLLAAPLGLALLQSQMIDEAPARVLGRAAQMLMLLGLWPFLHSLGLADRVSLGFTFTAAQLRRQIAVGWILGALMMAGILALLVVSGARVLDIGQSGWLIAVLKTALRALLAGLLIALLEESFFRGALFTAIRRQGSLMQAAGWSAALYALVHFMKPHAPPVDHAGDAAAMLWMLGSVFSGLLDLRHLDSMFALWLAGVLLALLRARSGGIALGIGLHAGWVFVIQTGRRLSDGVDQSGWAWLAGDYDGVIGWLAAALLALLILLERVSCRPPRL